MLWVPSCFNKHNPPRSCPAEVHCQRDFKTVVSKAWMLGYVACTSATTGYSNSFQSLHDTLQSDNWEFWNVAPQRTNYFASVTGNDWSWPLNALHADAMDLETGNYQRATYHTSISLFHSPKLASKAHCMAVASGSFCKVCLAGGATRSVHWLSWAPVVYSQVTNQY